MSRLIIKNLPKYYTREEFKKLFESQGTVTDAKIMFTKDGINRRFGYIGYKNSCDAIKALEYFNNSYIDICRISVELARSVADSGNLQTWSKYSQKEEKQEKKDADQFELDEKKKEMVQFLEEPDDKLLEFLHLSTTKGSGKRKTWDNDFSQTVKPIGSKIDSNLSLDADEYQDLKQSQDEEADHMKNEEADHIKFNDKISDLDYLKSKMKLDQEQVLQESDQGQIHPSRLQKMNGEKENVAEISVVDKMEIQVNTIKQVQKDKEEENPLSLIGETGRLFVRNLPFDANEMQLRDKFESFGEIRYVRIVLDKITQKSKGSAFIQFKQK